MIWKILTWLFEPATGKGTNSTGPDGHIRKKCPKCGYEKKRHYGGPM